jgi:hypothetical protein
VKIQEILNTIQNAQNLQNDDLMQLRAMLEEYPFFQIPYVILAKREFEKTPDQKFFLSWAAVHSSNRKRLKTIITGEQPSEKIPESPKKQNKKNENLLVEEKVKSKSSSKKKLEIQEDPIIPRKKLQNEIIETFAKKDIRPQILDPFEEVPEQEDLSENSTILNIDLVSEPYAKLLVKQGKKSKAKEIYEKLMVKFPNKSSYFAELIKELE